MKSNYHERRAKRKEAYENLAAKNQMRSETAYHQAKKIGSFIPFGQPILVGHHSEARHRRDIKKIDSNMKASIEADKKASYYESRLKNFDSNTSISSDNPDAIALLGKKIETLEAFQNQMKAVNKIIKSKKNDEVKIEEIIKIGLTHKMATELLTKDFAGRLGFPAYKLTNNNATIKNTKSRLATLKKLSNVETTEQIINGVRVVDNVEDNRLQFFFDGKPQAQIITLLKKNGFRWTPSLLCWQRFRSNHNQYYITHIINTIIP